VWYLDGLEDLLEPWRQAVEEVWIGNFDSTVDAAIR